MLVKLLHETGEPPHTYPRCAMCQSDKVDYSTGSMVDIDFSVASDSASVKIVVAVHAQCLRKKLP